MALNLEILELKKMIYYYLLFLSQSNGSDVRVFGIDFDN